MKMNMPMPEYWLNFLQGSGISQPVTQTPAGRDISDALQDVATVSQTLSDFEILVNCQTSSQTYTIRVWNTVRHFDIIALNSKMGKNLTKKSYWMRLALGWCQLFLVQLQHFDPKMAEKHWYKTKLSPLASFSLINVKVDVMILQVHQWLYPYTA